jgi:hypothetical protein
MDRVHPMRTVHPVTSPRDGPDPEADAADGNPRSLTLAELRDRLLRMILDNERDRRHEKRRTAG